MVNTHSTTAYPATNNSYPSNRQQPPQQQTTAAPSPYSIPTGRGVISEVTPARLLARLVLAFY